MDGDIHHTIQVIIHLIGGTMLIIHIVMAGIPILHTADMDTGDTMTIIIQDITLTDMDIIINQHIIIIDIRMEDLVTTDTTIVACQTAQHMDIAIVLIVELTAESQM
jgi:hypothetical protein